MRLSVFGIAFAICIGISQPALAVSQVSTPITLSAADIGHGVKLTYNGFIDETATSGLRAGTGFRLDSVTNGGRSWTFTYRVQNLFMAPVTASRVSIFGFDVDGYSSSNLVRSLGTASATGTYNVVARNGNVPQIGPKLDVCFRAGGGGGNCANGGGGGISAANSFTQGTFTLNFASAVQRIMLDNFFVRYQSVTTANGSGLSGVGVVDTFQAVVPEPGVWAQLIAGFGLIGAVQRRRRFARVPAAA